MNSIYISFSLKSFSSCLELTKAQEAFEKDYQTVYKSAVKFLYSHPEFPFAFAFSGPQLQFYKKRKNEFLKILKDMQERNQIEFLGGAYYDSILPLAAPLERSAQIDLLSSEIRQTLGKRPRGITLYADSWDSSLVNTLQTEKIEYVLLESSIIPANKRKFLINYMSVIGKSIEIIPYYDSLIPQSDTTPEEFVEKLQKAVEKIERKDSNLQLNPDRIVNISLNHEKMAELLENGWFEKFAGYIKNNEECQVILTTVEKYRKGEYLKVPVSVSSGFNRQFARNLDFKAASVFDVLEQNNPAKILYNRMLFISMIINHTKADKMRKKAAKEKLMQAHSGYGLLLENNNAYELSKNRQQLFKYLMDAEKILREDPGFSEVINCYDYDNNGDDEYVCCMNNYFAYISLISGAVQELEVVKNTGNYTDNLSRQAAYDDCDDLYQRGLFVDHVFTQEQFDNYVQGKETGTGIFSRIRYNQFKFNQKHNEIQLYSEAVIPELKQKVSLRKNYIINSTGMIVQYIFKNESSRPVHIKLAVESNFANAAFEPENSNFFSVELVDNEEIVKLDSSVPSEQLNQSGKLKDVDIVRLTDNTNGISFCYEPNETCGYIYRPVVFRRQDLKTGSLMSVSMTTVSTLYWDINLEAGKESEKSITEKNINFTITSVKKVRKNK